MAIRRALPLLLLSMLLVTLLPAPKAHAQGGIPQEEALQMLATLSPEERVGQLFLVTFKGTATDVESPVYDLAGWYYWPGTITSVKRQQPYLALTS